jgi:hypothetical protein
MDEKLKRRRRLYFILAVIALLMLAGIISLNRTLESLVKKEFNNQIKSGPDLLYDIALEDIKINIFTGSIKILNIKVTPTDSANNLLHDGKIKTLVVSQVSVFKISELQILDFIRYKKIDIEEIDLTGFKVNYLINANIKEPEHKNTLFLHNLFSDQFQGANVGTIRLNAEELRIFHVDNKDSAFFEIDTVQLLIKDITMNPETIKKSIPVDFKDIQIKTGHFTLNSMKYYSIFTAEVYFDIAESYLKIDGFRLIPKLSKAEYNRKISYNNDWFSIATQSIKLNGLNIEDFANNGMLSFSSLQIEGPDIEIYRDKRLPDAPFKYKPLLGGLIHKIPIPVYIDTLNISDGKLRYGEQTDASDQPGVVFFDPLSLTVLNITNDSALIAANPVMQIDFNGKIMAEANLDARLDIDLASRNEAFEINGTLEPVTGTAFNPMVEHLLPVLITSADISKTTFSFTANDDISHGELIMEYDNLAVEVIKGKEHDKRAGLISVVANGLIHGKNTPDHGKYRTGNIRFERRKDKGLVNFLWNSCKTGIISIIAPIADHTKKDERKETREEKKEEHGSKKEHKNKKK